MTREEKINKTVNSIKQVTFGRVDAEWIDAFKEGMRVALEAEEIEQSLRTCDSCRHHIVSADETNMWCTLEDGHLEDCRVDTTFGCNKWEQKQ